MTDTPEYNLPGLINKLQEIQDNPPESLDVENKKFFIENLTKVYHGLARVLSNFSMEYLDDHNFEDELFKGEMEERSEKRNKSSLQQQTEEAKEVGVGVEEEEKGAAGAEEEEKGAAGAGAGAEGAGEAEAPTGEAKAPTGDTPSSGGNKNSKTQKRKNQSQNKTQKNR